MVNLQTVGAVAFIIGVLLAVLSSALAAMMPAIAGYLPLALVILGLLVGFLNIGDKEIQAFLVAGIALVIVGIPNGTLLKTLDTVVWPLGSALAAMLQAIAVFAAPAVLVVSLKAFYTLARTPITGKAGK